MSKVLSSINLSLEKDLEITELEKRLEMMVLTVPVGALGSMLTPCDDDKCDCAGKGCDDTCDDKCSCAAKGECDGIQH